MHKTIALITIIVLTLIIGGLFLVSKSKTSLPPVAYVPQTIQQNGWVQYEQNQFGFSFGYPAEDIYGADNEFTELVPNRQEKQWFSGIVSTLAYGVDVGGQIISIGVYDDTVEARLERLLSAYDGSSLEDEYRVDVEELIVNNIEITKTKSWMEGKEHFVKYFFVSPNDKNMVVEFEIFLPLSADYVNFFSKFEGSLKVVD